MNKIIIIIIIIIDEKNLQRDNYNNAPKQYTKHSEPKNSVRIAKKLNRNKNKTYKLNDPKQKTLNACLNMTDTQNDNNFNDGN